MKRCNDLTALIKTWEDDRVKINAKLANEE